MKSNFNYLKTNEKNNDKIIMENNELLFFAKLKYANKNRIMHVS